MLFDIYAKHNYRIKGGNKRVALIYIVIYENKFVKIILYISGDHYKNSEYTYVKKVGYFSLITVNLFTSQVG